MNLYISELRQNFSSLGRAEKREKKVKKVEKLKAKKLWVSLKKVQILQLYMYSIS
jgi:hypothetical protein